MVVSSCPPIECFIPGTQPFSNSKSKRNDSGSGSSSSSPSSRLSAFGVQSEEPPEPTEGIRRPRATKSYNRANVGRSKIAKLNAFTYTSFQVKYVILFNLILASLISATTARELCFKNEDSDDNNASTICLQFYGLQYDYTEAAEKYQETDNKQLLPLPFDWFKISEINYPKILQFRGVPVIKEFTEVSQKAANDAPFIAFVGSSEAPAWDDHLNGKGPNEVDFHVRFRTTGGKSFSEDCSDVDQGDILSLSADYSFIKSNATNMWGVQVNKSPLLAKEFDSTPSGKMEQYVCICRKNDCKRASNSIDFYVETDNSVPLVYLGMTTIGLLCLSGIFSGLNLGLMALDPTELRTIKNVGADDTKRYAEKIEPIRSQGNFLLCTLLLGNTLVNAVLAVFLESIFQGPAAIIFSTLGIVTFGEIIPQSVCSRHGLKVGAQTILLTKFFMFITFPLSWPISKLLDYVLGEEIGATIKKRELLELIRQTNERDRCDLDNEEMAMVQGVLELSTKEVKDVMTRIGDCYMLERGTILNFKTIAEIMDQGYTRIPVYEDQRTNVTSLLFVRDLAFVDPDDNTPLKIISEFYAHDVKYIEKKQKLDDVLEEFRKNSYHLAIVYDEENDSHTKLPGENKHLAIGIVTLEDIIEELIRGEITDETDKFIDNVHFDINPKRHYKNGAEIYTKLAIQASETSAGEFNAANGTTTATLTAQQLLALHRFAITEIPCFSATYLKNESALKLLRTPAIVHAIDENASHEDRILYKKDTVCNYFIVILEGHVTVAVGDEGMEFDKGPFGYFGHKCLMQSLELQQNASSQNLNPANMVHQKKDLEDFLPDFSVLSKPKNKLVYVKVERKFYMQYIEKDVLQVQKMDAIQAKMEKKEFMISGQIVNTGSQKSTMVPGSNTFTSKLQSSVGGVPTGSVPSVSNFAADKQSIEAKMRAGTGTTTTFNYTPSNLLKDNSRAPSPSRVQNQPGVRQTLTATPSVLGGNETTPVTGALVSGTGKVSLTGPSSSLGPVVCTNKTKSHTVDSGSTGITVENEVPLQFLNTQKKPLNKHIITIANEESQNLLSKSRTNSRSEGQLAGSAANKKLIIDVKDEAQSECSDDRDNG